MIKGSVHVAAARQIFLLSLFVSAFATSSAYALPSEVEYYRNDELGTRIMADGSSETDFWFWPLIRPYQDKKTNEVKLIRRPQADGSVRYTFFLVPEFSDENRADAIRGITKAMRLSGKSSLVPKINLKPIIAKKFYLQVPQFNVYAEPAGNIPGNVTDYQYLNTPQAMKLVLPSAEDAEYFEVLFENAPGVAVNTAFTYDGEKVGSRITVELSYENVVDAMNIKANLGFAFAKADIEYGITKYVMENKLKVKSKGFSKIPDIVEKVISECFTPVPVTGNNRPGGTNPVNPNQPVVPPRPLGGSGSGSYPYPYPNTPGTLFGSDSRDMTEEVEFWVAELAREERSLRLPQVWSTSRSTRVLKKKDPRDEGEFIDDLLSEPGNSGTTGATVGAKPEIRFTFKEDRLERKGNFIFEQENVVDAEGLVVIPSFIRRFPEAIAPQRVTELQGRTVSIGVEHTMRETRNAKIEVARGDQWTMLPSFDFYAKSNYGDGKLIPYRWEKEWGSPFEHLYYRVGDSEWMPVLGRTQIDGNLSQSGSIEFYVDRESLWMRLPDKLRQGMFFLPAVFSYNKFFPRFDVQLRGRRHERN